MLLVQENEERTDTLGYKLDYNTIKVIQDWKNEKNKTGGKKNVGEWLENCGVAEETINVLRGINTLASTIIK